MSYADAPNTAYPGGRTQTQSNSFAVAGLVCGIVGLIVFAIVLGPLAIIFGALGVSRARQGAGRGTMAAWALGLGIADIVLWLVLLAVWSNGGLIG